MDKINSGVLFPNSYKKSDKQPDFTGNIILPDGTKMRLAGWANKSPKGQEYISVKISEFQQEQDKQNDKEFQDDKIPF